MNTRLGNSFGLLALSTLVLTFGLVALPGQSWADDDDKQTSRKTKVTSTIRLSLQKKLAEVQDLSEEKKYQESLEMISDIFDNTSKLSEFEKFQLHNFNGFVYYQMGQYDKALAEQQKIIAFKGIDPRFTEGAYFTAGQLYHLLGRTKEALKVLLRLEKVKTDKNDSSLQVFIAQLYYALEEYRKGLAYVKRAIKIVKSTRPSVSAEGEPLSQEDIFKLTTPRKNWYLLQRAFYQQLKQYKNMLQSDIEMVYFYPENENLLYLAFSLSLLERNKDQLSVLELLYDRGHLRKEAYIVQLANLQILHGIPYKAAVMVEKAMKKGDVKADKLDNLILLSRAWAEAKEDKKSIPPLKKAAAISETGREYDYLAKRYINLYQWGKAEDALLQALQKGGLRNPIGSKILLGQSQGESNKFKQGKKTFEDILREIRSNIPSTKKKLSQALRVKASKRDNALIKRLKNKAKTLERQLTTANNLLRYMNNQLETKAYLTGGRR